MTQAFIILLAVAIGVAAVAWGLLRRKSNNKIAALDKEIGNLVEERNKKNAADTERNASDSVEELTNDETTVLLRSIDAPGDTRKWN